MTPKAKSRTLRPLRDGVERLSVQQVVDFDEFTNDQAAKAIEDWLKKVSPPIMNVAGPRESTSQGIYSRVFQVLKKCLQGPSSPISNVMAE